MNFSTFITALQTADAGLSVASFLGKRLKPLIPSFLYRNAYYFEEVNKKVFIRKNGDAAVVCSCDLYVIKPDKVENIVRKFDITDAPKNTTFPSFKSIRKKKEQFFDGFSFWFESEGDIISNVEEYNGNDFSIHEKEDVRAGRLLGVKFLINKNKLTSKHRYRIIYGYSAPNLFPIKNGKHDSRDYRKKDYDYCTSMSLKHMAQKLRMSVYLENGIRIHEAPTGNAIRATSKQPIPSSICQVRDNVLYTKYLYEISRPEKYSAIQIKWKLK